MVPKNLQTAALDKGSGLWRMQKGKGAFQVQRSSSLELAQVWELRGTGERHGLYRVPESHAEQLGLHPGKLWGQ